MKIALIGASGFAGSAILTEALARGHEVTALVREPARLEARSGLDRLAVDALDSQALADALAGHDAVISAYSPGLSHPEVEETFGRAADALVSAARLSGIKRVLAVGGAATLEVAPGVQVLDTPDFPEAWKPVARGTARVLAALRAATDLDWTFLSPSAHFEPGPRTGNFRLGRDQLLVAADGNSSISSADYAVALLDELERPQHSRQRFTVGY